MNRVISGYIGDREFYKRVLAVAVPIMIQNAITNFVSMLDNIMVGRVGTEQMSGVAIVNQLLFVCYLCMFGAISGAGIFTAQYFGKDDNEGVRYTFRFKLIICAVIVAVTIGIMLTAGNNLIGMYLRGNDDGGDVVAALRYGQEYLLIMLIGLVPMMLSQVYSGTLRECGKTFVPMIAGITAVFVNLGFNYVLIYGKFGAPELGVAGAAIATVISRYVEAIVVIAWTHYKKDEHSYIIGMYRSMRIPKELTVNIIRKGMPLLVNETLWAAGMAVLVQCYSIRGMYVVAGLNICNTIVNIFNVVFFAMGDAVAILVGQLLGAGRMDEARDTARKLIVFGVLCAAVLAVIVYLTSGIFPLLYKPDAYTKDLAIGFTSIAACFMPQTAFLHTAYFTIRSGGKTFITFLFDSVFLWVAAIPVAFILSHFTGLEVFKIYIAVQFADSVKCIVAFILLKKEIWLNNIVEN